MGKMNKAILISIRPEHLINILNGKKTLELRKTAPFPLGRGRWVYLYCTKGDYDILDQTKRKDRPNIPDYRFIIRIDKRRKNEKLWNGSINQKVVARFWFDEFEYIAEFSAREMLINVLDRLSITKNELKNYLKGKYGYAWHIKKLEIFDEPMSLSDLNIKRPPQSWQYINIKEESNK